MRRVIVKKKRSVNDRIGDVDVVTSDTVGVSTVHFPMGKPRSGQLRVLVVSGGTGSATKFVRRAINESLAFSSTLSEKQRK